QKTKIALVGEDWDVIDLIENLPHLELVGLFAPTVIHGTELRHLGSDADWKADNATKIVIAVDLPKVRQKLFDHYCDILTLVSPNCYVSLRAHIGEGCIIQRGVTLMAHAKLGRGCKINLNATIHHDVSIGDFCTIAPGAIILGHVTIEQGAYIGAGAIIKQRCRIGSHAIVGAGAVVVRDVPDHTTVVGVPAQPKSVHNV
ncbi:MAG: acetyltransferase, partial [Verrucomicrobia bacterium]|nr:acetyltransferase [Verrucomicrobiota bacterium]